MKITPLDILIAFGRKLEELKRANAEAEIDEETLENDEEAKLLLQLTLLTAVKLQEMGLEPLNPQLFEYLGFREQLRATVSKYLPE